MSLCGSAPDTRLAVYSFFGLTCATLGQPVACNDNFCGVNSQVTFTSGPINFAPYLIRLGGATSADVGDIALTITQN